MTTINNLPELTTITNQLILPVMDQSESPPRTKKVTLQQLVALSAGPRGFPGTPGIRGAVGPSGPVGPTGPASTSIPKLLIKTTVTNYTIENNDHGYFIKMNNPASTATVFLADNTISPVDVGTQVIVSKSNTGDVLFATSGSSVILSSGSVSINNRYGRVNIIKTSTNTWEIDGDL